MVQRLHLVVSLMVIFPSGSLEVCSYEKYKPTRRFSQMLHLLEVDAALGSQHSCSHRIFYVATVTLTGDIYSLSGIFEESYFGVLWLQAIGALSNVSFGIKELRSFRKCWKLQTQRCDGESAANYTLLLAYYIKSIRSDFIPQETTASSITEGFLGLSFREELCSYFIIFIG